MPGAKTRLRLICVGTGRDGTQSLTHMFRDVLDQIGQGQTVAHEYGSRAFFEASAQVLRGDRRGGVARARALIAECPHEVIVGNGYAAWLPLFAELCGREARLVHVRRADRSACIESLRQNAMLHPAAYGNYVAGEEAVTDRPTAWHYDELTRRAWDELSLAEKLGWYYDKVHALVGRYAHLFAEHFDVYTERLSDRSTQHLVGELASGPPRRARPVHLNSHVDASALSPDARHKVQWLLGRLDRHRVACDDLYPLKYILNEYIAWTGYQIHRSEHIGREDHRSREELAAALAEAHETLVTACDLVRRLQTDLSATSFAEDSTEDDGPAPAGDGGLRAGTDA